MPSATIEYLTCHETVPQPCWTPNFRTICFLPFHHVIYCVTQTVLRVRKRFSGCVGIPTLLSFSNWNSEYVVCGSYISLYCACCWSSESHGLTVNIVASDASSLLSHSIAQVCATRGPHVARIEATMRPARPYGNCVYLAHNCFSLSCGRLA